MNLNSAITLIDVGVVVGYLIFTLWLGWFVSRKHANTEDFFLAGRKLGWLVIGFSLFASNISSTTLVGLSGQGYQSGISVYNYEWMAVPILVFFVFFLAPYYIKARVYTTPEYLEKRFSSRVRSYFSGLTIFANVFIDTAGTLFAGAIVIKFFLPEVEVWQSALVLAAIAGAYTALGGLSAVVYTDVIQALLLLFGTTYIAVEAFSMVESWDAVRSQLPPDHLSLIRPISDDFLPWTGLVFGVPVIGFYFWCTNQFMVQRVLGARNLDHARWGSLWGAFLKLPVLFLMVFPGIFARFFLPELPDPNLVFPTLIGEILPVGVRGLVLAGLLAAILSSLDSTLHSASTLVTMDFLKKSPGIKERDLTRWGRIITLTIMVVSAAWTPIVAQFTTLFEYLQMSLSYVVPPVASIFIVAIFFPRAEERGAFWGLLGGHLLSLGLLANAMFDLGPEIHFLHAAGLLFFFSIGVHLLVSRWIPSGLTPKVALSLSAADLHSDCDGTWKDFRLWSILLLLLTALIVGLFW